jgi:Holliday junction resolvase RusA-like endonuclease
MSRVRIVKHRAESPRHASKPAKAGKAKGTAPKPVRKARQGRSRLEFTWDDASVTATNTGWRFEIPVPGSGNRMWRKGRGRTYKHAEHTGHCQQAAHRFRHVSPLVGDVAVSIAWHREKRVGDVDNRTKTTLDILTGIAYVDDGQVADLRVRRFDDGSPARLVVTVDRLEAA